MCNGAHHFVPGLCWLFLQSHPDLHCTVSILIWPVVLDAQGVQFNPWFYTVSVRGISLQGRGGRVGVGSRIWDGMGGS